MTNLSTHPSILDAIFGEQGYSTAFLIDDAELAFLRDAIREQWITRIEEVHPEYAEQFRLGGIEQYHLLSHLISHESLWTKDNRVLPKEVVSTLTDFNFMRRLRKEFGETCRINDVTFFDGTTIPHHPELTWRLVRPTVTTDVGGMHTDKWFHDIHATERQLFADDEVTIKMWLAIFTEPGLNGLYVVPGSHRKQWRVRHTTAADGYDRPSLDETLDGHEKKLMRVEPGQAVLFNENLLHGGALNKGLSSRISIEATFVLKRSSIPK
jgi:hypothetical protein